MNGSKYFVVACLLTVVAAGPAALADNTFTYQITADTYLDSANPTENFGLSGSDKVVINNKNTSSPSMCRTLFDLPTSLWSYSPSSIVSASVSFYVWNDNTGTYNVSLFPLTTTFVVGTGNGTATANGATWLTYDGVNSWTTSGGDFDSANSVVGAKGTLGVNPGDPNGRFFTFDITSLLANPTAEAELQNYGAMLSIDIGQALPPGGQQYYASFTSANSSSYTIPYLPSLEVTVVPEPSSAILVMAGLAALTCFPKKRQARC
jgi:hypothetical protein